MHKTEIKRIWKLELIWIILNEHKPVKAQSHQKVMQYISSAALSVC